MTNPAAPDYASMAQALSIETRAFINGKLTTSLSGRTFITENPATGRSLAQIAECREEDVNLAVAAARRAFDTGPWRKMPPRERKKVLLRLADIVERHAEELALLESLDTGKPIADALTADLPDAIETLRWHAEAIDKLYDSLSPTATDIVSMIVREPIGVVAAVVPWNFPLAITAMKVGPVLAGGNSIVIKPAEQSPLTAIKLATLTAEAGLPPGVLNVLPGYGETAGKSLGLHPDVNCVSFTGSTEIGRYFL